MTTNAEWRDFRKVPVMDYPDAFVLLTQVRLFATNLYATALVDSTGRLAEPTSLKLTPSLEQARRNANNLVNANGGEAPYSYTPPAPDRGSTEPEYKPGRNYEKGRFS